MMAARNPGRRHSVMAPAQPSDGLAVTHALVEAATNGGYSPSIHDTQPWRWRIAGKSLDLFAERQRTLDAIDPDARLAVLSCGAALHHARVSLAAQGWHSVVTRMPDPGDRTYLAQLRVDVRAAVEPSAMHHLRTITLRHTDRRPVSNVTPTLDALHAITASVEAEDSHLHILTADQVLELTRAAENAHRTEPDESPWHEELTYWTGTDAPLNATADHPATFALLYGSTDGRAGWLRAGEALSAGWLTATEHGISVLPFSAPIEVSATLQALSTMIDGHPYLLLRLGTATPTEPVYSPRLPSAQTIERS